MSHQTSAQLQKCYPTAASGITITPSSTSWGNSSYVELHSSTPSAWLITGVTVNPSDSVGGSDRQFELDISTGVASSEVVKATIKAGADKAAEANENHGYIPITIPFLIPAASRIAIRLRKNGTSVLDFNGIALTYMESPNTDIQTTSNLLRVTPSASSLIHVIDAASWANPASFTTIVASAAADLCIIGIPYRALNGSPGTGEFELDLAKGAASSEVVKYTYKAKNSYQYVGTNYHALRVPSIAFLTGDRISARVRHSGSGTGVGLDIGLVYYHLPL